MSRRELLYWFILAFAFRLMCYVGSDSAPTLRSQLLSDHWENVEIASGLLSGHGFSGVLPDHKELPSAWCPPGAVLLVAGMKWVLKDSAGPMIMTVYLWNSALDGLTTALVGRLGMALGGRVVGILAFFIHLFVPNLIRFGFWAWDMPQGNLAVVLLLEGTILRRDLPTRREDILAGAGLCLAGMFSGPALFVGPTILLSRWFRTPSLRAAFASCLVFCASFLICQAPWIIRNALALGSPVLTRSNYLINAHMANVPSPGMQHAVRINSLPAQGALYAQHGEMGYARLCSEKFWHDVRAYPKDYAIRCTFRLFELWVGRVWGYWGASRMARAIGSENVQASVPLFPPALIDDQICERYEVGVLILALIGAIGMAWIGKGREAVLMASILVFATLVYTPCHVEDRFRDQFESLLALLAAFGLAFLTGTYGWGVSRPYPRLVVPVGEGLRWFFLAKPRSRASLLDTLWRSAVTALVAPLIFLYPLAVETSVLNKTPVGLHNLFDTLVWIVAVTFFLDLFRRILFSKP